MNRAARTDSERMFYLGPFLAQALLGTDLPHEVRSKLQNDSLLRSLANEIRERLFNGPEHIPATPRQIFRFNVELRKSWQARARYFVHALRPTDGDVGAFSLPRPLNFAYYLIRPVRLLVANKP